MASAGWYPDPGGQQGMYRYWDGHAWSAVTSPNPSAPPPSPGIGQPTDPAQQPGQSGPEHFGAHGAQPTGYQAYQDYQQQAKKRSPVGWWIGAGALVVVIILVVVLVVRSVGGGGVVNNPLGPDGGSETENPCPTTTQEPTADGNAPNDGRVHGGPISYPMLPSPWSGPQPDDRVPFGSDVQVQQIVIEPSYDGGPNSWVASVLVARLMAGDGFFTPEQGSEIVAKCIVGRFYGDNPVQREDRESKAMKIDGHDAWYLESFLSFDIEGLEATGETMIVVIVNAGETSGLYYASIPNNAEQHLPAARKALQQIKVDG